jgi:NADPH-dependent 7-cyano-7-deazaguanine reductase QueF-like protein
MEERKVEDMDIYEKLNRIQVELKVPKSNYNEFGNYNYRSVEDIMTGIKPLLDKYKCTLILQDYIELIGDRFYVRAVATLTDIDNGCFVTTCAYAREDLKLDRMTGTQTTGATSSYARKYALNGLFCIDDIKDVDALNNGEKVANSKPQSKPSNQQGKPQVNRAELIVKFNSEIARTGKSAKWFLEQAKVNDAKFLKTEKLTEYVGILEKLPTKE